MLELGERSVENVPPQGEGPPACGGVVQQHEDPREEKLRAGRYMGLTKDKHFRKFSVQFWYFC